MTMDASYVHKFVFIKDIINYLEIFKKEWVTFEEFILLRKKYIKDIDSLNKMMSGWIKNESPQKDAFPEEILAIEKQVIADLFI